MVLVFRSDRTSSTWRPLCSRHAHSNQHPQHRHCLQLQHWHFQWVLNIFADFMKVWTNSIEDKVWNFLSYFRIVQAWQALACRTICTGIRRFVSEFLPMPAYITETVLKRKRRNIVDDPAASFLSDDISHLSVELYSFKTMQKQSSKNLAALEESEARISNCKII